HVQFGAAHAVGGDAGGRHGGDDLVDADFIVIQRQGQARDVARLIDGREGEGFRLFRLQVRVAARDAGDARGVVRTEVVGVGGGFAGEVERQALLCGQGRTVLDAVGLDLLVVESRDVGRGAGVAEVVGERLAVRRVVLTQLRHADRGVEAGLEGQIADPTVNEVHAENVYMADGRIASPAVRAAQIGVLTPET